MSGKEMWNQPPFSSSVAVKSSGARRCMTTIIAPPRIVDDRKLGPKARDGSPDRGREALTALGRGQEIFGLFDEDRFREDPPVERRNHYAPGQARQLARQVVTIADAKNAFRGFDAEQPG